MVGEKKMRAWWSVLSGLIIGGGQAAVAQNPTLTASSQYGASVMVAETLVHEGDAFLPRSDRAINVAQRTQFRLNVTENIRARGVEPGGWLV